MSSSSAAALEVRDLTVAYGQLHPTLNNVSLTVPRGSVVALLGANGAGKTTTISAVSGLLGAAGGRIVSGSITLDGADLSGLDARARVRRGLSQVLEGRHVFPDLTLDENLLCGAITRRDRAEVAADLGRVYERFPDLAHRRTEKAGLLSGGQQQMLVIGRALMSRPAVLLLDEPSLGLAPVIVAQVGEIISRIRDEGTSVLLVEQNVRLALALSDHAYVLENGAVALDGPSATLRDDPRVQAAYLGGHQGEHVPLDPTAD
ncbi:ABC transporter ATP-binding protein [Microbacterium sp. NPDC058062]|uniref:ABC transporter ATP-binding protein n=1 Tax=Microbacterium sp. NPDC058062 TaxID=3346320 RepID=UPI0036D866B9